MERRRPVLSHCSSETWGKEKREKEPQKDEPTVILVDQSEEADWKVFFQLPPISGDYRPDAASFLWVPAVQESYSFLLSDPEGKTLAAANFPPSEPFLQRHVVRVGDFRGTARAEWFCRGALVYSQRVPFQTARLLAAVSCDYRQMDTKRSLWEEMDPNVDLVLHLGDNIYGDHEFFRGLSLLRSSRFRGSEGARRSSAHEIIRAEYEENYRRSWARWAYHLRHCRHLMIPDDHDVTNGYNSEAFRPGTLEDEVSQIALEVFRRYQRGLEVEDGEGGNRKMEDKKGGNKEEDFEPQEKKLRRISRKSGKKGPPEESETPEKSEIPDLFLSRWLDSETLLCLCERASSGGRSATAELIEALEREAAGARKLVLAFGAAPLPPAGGFYGKLYRAVYGADGLWSPGEALSVYEFLQRWLGAEENAGNERKALLLGGDIHIGVEAVLKWGEDESKAEEDPTTSNCGQEGEKDSTSSDCNNPSEKGKFVPICVLGPMSNQPTAAEIIYAKGLREAPLGVGPFRVEINQARALRNYSSVDLENMEAETRWSGRRYPRQKKNLPKALLQLTGHLNGISGR